MGAGPESGPTDPTGRSCGRRSITLIPEAKEAGASEFLCRLLQSCFMTPICLCDWREEVLLIWMRSRGVIWVLPRAINEVERRPGKAPPLCSTSPFASSSMARNISRLRTFQWCDALPFLIRASDLCLAKGLPHRMLNWHYRSKHQSLIAVSKGLAHIYGAAPGVVEKAGEYFRAQLRHVEASLEDGRRYLMGNRFTSADILLTTCLVWAIEYGVGVCDNALPYLARVTSRPAYTKSAAVNAAAI
jgi:glutathione S-transferase